MKSLISLILFFLIISLFVSCKKDKNKPKEPNSDIPSLISGQGWTIENKYKMDLKDQFLVGIDNESVVKYNNDFYWKLRINANDPIFGGSSYFVYFKLQNSTISEFIPQAPNFNTKTDAFYFLENDPSERSAVLNNGFKLFKDKTPTFSGWDLLFWPNNLTMDLHLSAYQKHTICYNIANFSTITTLNLETGKFSRYRNYGGIGFNNGSFVIDEKYNNANPNSFKAFHSSLYYTGNYKMHLIIGEICDTIKSKFGDPSSNSNANEGYYIINKPVDTSYLCNLGGIGYNFGDGYTKSVDAGDRVYIWVTCKGMAEYFRIYSFDKTTHKLTYLYGNNAFSSAKQIFYRKGKNDLIINNEKGIHRLDLSTMSLYSISPITSSNVAFSSLLTQPYSNGAYSDKIYGVACTINGLTTKANLVFFE